MSKTAQICENCRYWSRTIQLDKGECRVDPPKGIPIPSPAGLNIITFFPTTDPNFWCGKFENRHVDIPSLRA